MTGRGGGGGNGKGDPRGREKKYDNGDAPTPPGVSDSSGGIWVGLCWGLSEIPLTIFGLRGGGGGVGGAGLVAEERAGKG